MRDPNYNAVVPKHIPSSHVHDFDIYEQETRDPFLAVADLFAKGVPEIFWTRHQGGHWCVLGAEAITGLSEGDPTLFSAKKLMVPEVPGDEMLFPPNDTDPPLHTAYRAAIAPLFSPARVEGLRSGVRELARKLIAELKGRGECEFMDEFAAQLPVIVFLKLADLPIEDRRRLRDIADRVINPVEDAGNRLTPLDEMGDYLLPYIEERMAKPGDDAISYVIQQKVNGRSLELDEVLKLTRSMVLAGLDTVAAMLGYFVHYLAETPELRRELIEHPESISRAVEEILRRHPPGNIGRYLTRDVVYRGVKMKAGEHVVWPVGMYNFDPKRFSEAIKVKLDRPNGRSHATFGVGHHFCVGAGLARAELRIFAEEWLREIPDFHLKPGTRPKYRGGWVTAYKELKIVLQPR
jgi:camphor 5-monooxygenase